jgi:hypothetical protein
MSYTTLTAKKERFFIESDCFRRDLCSACQKIRGSRELTGHIKVHELFQATSPKITLACQQTVPDTFRLPTKGTVVAGTVSLT